MSSNKCSCVRISVLNDQLQIGTIVWQNFVDQAPEVLRQLYLDDEEDDVDDGGAADEDWMPLPVKEGRKRREFWYNKRTGESQWDQPVMEETEDDCPTIFDYLKFLGYKCKKVDVEDIIWEVDEDCDGCVSWAEFQTM